ncbi:C-type lectin 37Db-like, partial [Drosophila serrata]|uniref:C-type lectin 37Db-like n=1 Tax=Drosophila serrata TaxID=7274 RepID=UPI000A1D2341
RIAKNYEKIGSKYYHFENDEVLNWYEAQDKCISLNGNLISLKNEGEWNAITARLNKQSSYWVDLNDLEKEGEFKSETSGQAAPFLKWDIAEPNNLAFSINNENCVELRAQYNHYMNDNNCYSKNYYICEANLNDYPTKESQQ